MGTKMTDLVGVGRWNRFERGTDDVSKCKLFGGLQLSTHRIHLACPTKSVISPSLGRILLPSARKEVNFGEGVGESVDVTWSQVDRLYHVHVQRAVIVVMAQL